MEVAWRGRGFGMEEEGVLNGPRREGGGGGVCSGQVWPCSGQTWPRVTSSQVWPEHGQIWPRGQTRDQRPSLAALCGQTRPLVTAAWPAARSGRAPARPGHDSLLCGVLSWCRGPMIGQGAFGSVYRAELKKPRLGESRLTTSFVAVKSADPLNDDSLLREKAVLDAIQGCPHVLQTFGADTTKTTNGIVLYNVLLEFASGGSLADLIVKSNGHGLSESDVRKHTKSMLVGLKHIHARGFVHCDLKPDNVLLVPTADGFELKIADLDAQRELTVARGCLGEDASCMP